MSRTRRLSAPLVVGLALTIGASTACSSDDPTSTSSLDQVAPTKRDIARDAGISFPRSTDNFRLVRISAGQIDVAFTIASEDVDTFAERSGFTLVEDDRVITHASPLWDVAVTAPLRGAASVRNGVKRSLEVVDGGDRAVIRLSLEPKN